MGTSASDAYDTGGSSAHPRFTRAPRELGPDEPTGAVRRFPDRTGTAAEAAGAAR
ncbi:hypothetical protein [Streptomyces sp. NRRL B-1347]|uniref:hypothetical protein n=1 Tax=Streptomyces sp. NRRL B-1347 TaxID=1476877 RepID=UPI0018FE514D|nr:hypothetical protein [Streptomyces sp. NRRL B-1347]